MWNSNYKDATINVTGDWVLNMTVRRAYFSSLFGLVWKKFHGGKITFGLSYRLTNWPKNIFMKLFLWKFSSPSSPFVRAGNLIPLRVGGGVSCLDSTPLPPVTLLLVCRTLPPPRENGTLPFPYFRGPSGLFAFLKEKFPFSLEKGAANIFLPFRKVYWSSESRQEL